MITKIYSAECDECGNLIQYYFHHKPNIKTLRKDAGYVRINNGKIFLFCRNCANKGAAKEVATID